MILDKDDIVEIDGIEGKVALADEELFVFVPKVPNFNPQEENMIRYDYSAPSIYSNLEGDKDLIDLKIYNPVTQLFESPENLEG